MPIVMQSCGNITEGKMNIETLSQMIIIGAPICAFIALLYAIFAGAYAYGYRKAREKDSRNN